MSLENNIILGNGVEVSFCPHSDGLLERMISLAKTPDFLAETENMKERGLKTPFNFVIYDDILALGLSTHRGDVDVRFFPYDELFFVDRIDMALSLRGHPVAVVNKTSSQEEFLKRISSRTKLDWIEYDEETGILREVAGKPCLARTYLMSQPASRDLYALYEYARPGEEGVLAVHMRIDTNRVNFFESFGLSPGIQCIGSIPEEYHEPIDDVEKRIRAEHPHTLVMKSPLAYCVQGCEEKPYSCLACVFEKVYAEKTGIMDSFKEYPIQN